MLEWQACTCTQFCAFLEINQSCVQTGQVLYSLKPKILTPTTGSTHAPASRALSRARTGHAQVYHVHVTTTVPALIPSLCLQIRGSVTSHTALNMNGSTVLAASTEAWPLVPSSGNAMGSILQRPRGGGRGGGVWNHSTHNTQDPIPWQLTGQTSD